MKYIKYSYRTIRNISNRIAETVVIRSYHNGNSSDDRRPTTDEEKHQIAAVVYGALANLNYHIYSIGYNYHHLRDSEILHMMQTARDTAEWTIDELFRFEDGEINGYDTVYCPVWAMSEKLWGKSEEYANRYMKLYGLTDEDIEIEAEVKIS